MILAIEHISYFKFHCMILLDNVKWPDHPR